MAPLLAGVGRSIITPHDGVPMSGYANRELSHGVHDDLNARAVVLDNGTNRLALCSVELLWQRKEDTDQVRQAVAARCALRPAEIFLFTTHTHSGPLSYQPENWDFPLFERVADAIVTAYDSRQPARLGNGFGQLYGYNINRRWINRPADPSIGVMRVDRADGSPLALLGNYACHAVVMGADNLKISGDWPGYASRILENEMGAGTVALFSQGGAGDVNPLTETVRQRLAAGHPISAIGEVSNYYGYQPDAPDAWNIGDRAGGTFFECETLARAYSAEVIRVWRRIVTEPAVAMWAEQVTVEGAVGPEEPPAAGMEPDGIITSFGSISGSSLPMDIRLIGIGSAVFLGEPGEVFSETAIEFRKHAQQLGYSHPWLISYANGSYAYLPPANAFPEGGYEVKWALGLGISRHLQDRIAAAIDPLLTRHAPR